MPGLWPSLGLYGKLVGRWYLEAVAQGLDRGLLKPGESKGVPCSVLLSVQNQEATKVIEEVNGKQQDYMAALQKGALVHVFFIVFQFFSMSLMVSSGFSWSFLSVFRCS